MLIVLGLACLDGLIRLNADLWTRHSPDDYDERVRGCAVQPRDFVIVGGSPVSEGVVPDELAGFTWRGETLRNGYAVGLPGATTSESYHAVLRSCPTAPKLLIYGITASDINDGRQEPHGAYSLMKPADLWAWVVSRPESAEYITRHYVYGRLNQVWAAYQYRHGIRMWAALQAEACFPGCCPHTLREAQELHAYAQALRNGNGYAPAAGFVNTRYDEVKRLNAETPPFKFLDKFRTGSHLKCLHRMIDWCAKHGTSLVLVDMPVTADLEAQYPNQFAEYRRRLTEVETARDVLVIHAHRDLIGLTDSDFSDTVHLNGGGARKLSRWLREQLTEVGTGPDSELLAARRAAP
jgi:hypothetical protein